MPTEPSVPVAIVSALLAATGIVGIVVPVLPGSLAILGALLLWAIAGGSAWGWVVFGIGAVLVLTGSIASTVLTSRRLQARAVPNRSVVVGLVCGVAGLFLLPGFGLPIGFLLGLLLSEWQRVRDPGAALSSSAAALRAIGTGMLIELSCAVTATTVLGVGIAAAFLVR